MYERAYGTILDPVYAHSPSIFRSDDDSKCTEKNRVPDWGEDVSRVCCVTGWRWSSTVWQSQAHRAWVNTRKRSSFCGKDGDTDYSFLDLPVGSHHMISMHSTPALTSCVAVGRFKIVQKTVEDAKNLEKQQQYVKWIEIIKCRFGGEAMSYQEGCADWQES